MGENGRILKGLATSYTRQALTSLLGRPLLPVLFP